MAIPWMDNADDDPGDCNDFNAEPPQDRMVVRRAMTWADVHGDESLHDELSEYADGSFDDGEAA